MLPIEDAVHNIDEAQMIQEASKPISARSGTWTAGLADLLKLVAELSESLAQKQLIIDRQQEQIKTQKQDNKSLTCRLRASAAESDRLKALLRQHTGQEQSLRVVFSVAAADDDPDSMEVRESTGDCTNPMNESPR